MNPELTPPVIGQFPPLESVHTPDLSSQWALANGLWPVLISAIDDKKFPAKSRGKAPIGKNWGLVRQDRRWFAASFKRNKGANVGLLLGPSGGVVDIDVDEPDQAAPTLERIFPDGIPPTLGWENAGGKFHLIFLWDDRLLPFVGKTGIIKGGPNYPGLELRIGGPGKQVQSVIPPSMLPNGVKRKWNGNTVILPLPESFFADLEKFGANENPVKKPLESVWEDPGPTTVRTGGTTVKDMGLTFLDPVARAARYLAKCEPAVEGQDGSGKCLWAACKMVEFGLDYDTALHLLMKEYNPRCKGPWSEAEMRHKLDAAFDKAERGKMLEAGRNGHHTNGDGHHQGNGTATAEPDWAKIGEEEANQAARERVLESFANYAWEEGEDDEGKPKSIKVGLSMLQLSGRLEEIVGKWPKRVGETLFAEASDHEPVYLTSPARLFAWISKYAQVDWAKGGQYISQEQFHEHLRMNAERYEAIETLPHWPPLPNIFYMHRPVPPPGGKLKGLVDSFTPATPEDRELIEAMILTPFWGGEPGQKPAVLITGPDHDAERGRGIGKTTLLDLLFDGLLDGSLDVSPSSDMEKVKTRMLSASGRHCRAARIDNIKTLKLSWDELEKIITCPMISGHAMYEGEGRRPNTLVWGLTLNGASLSTDMAQRCVVIKLGRPKFEAGWKERVRKYIADNRWEIIADVGKILESEVGPLAPKTRWASWERGVLSRVGLAKECQALIAERMMEADADHEETEIVAEHFREMLRLHRHDPDDGKIFVPTSIAAEWLAVATRENRSPGRANSYIAGLGIPELRRSAKDGDRGWLWTGPKAKSTDTTFWFDHRGKKGADF